jgi:hypothetical protein
LSALLYFQEQNNPTKEKIVSLCKMRGLILDSVNEMNELSETRLISAAAEGRSMMELSLLVRAGADVNGTRPDGVTAIWLAAQVNINMGRRNICYSLISLFTKNLQ